MSEWLETCEACEGKGCAACRQQGYVAHLCPSTEDMDEVAALLAQDDQLKADLNRDAEIATYFFKALINHGMPAQPASQLVDTFYQAWVYE